MWRRVRARTRTPIVQLLGELRSRGVVIHDAAGGEWFGRACQPKYGKFVIRGMGMRSISGLVPVLFAAGIVFAQPQDSRPAYVAASVKPNTSGSENTSSNGSKGQIVFTNQTLKRLIERAYNLKPFQLSGPDWLDAVRFDIAAKYPPDTKNEDRTLMLRTLLEDRFKLAVHRQSKEMPGYVLVVGKKFQAQTGRARRGRHG